MYIIKNSTFHSRQCYTSSIIINAYCVQVQQTQQQQDDDDNEPETSKIYSIESAGQLVRILANSGQSHHILI